MKHQAKKRFGQNFLINHYIIQSIISAGDFKPDDRVVEIGPGLGALTKPLLQCLDNLDAIEIDQDVLETLEDLNLHASGQLHLYHQDVLKTDFNALFAKIHITSEHQAKLIGNLPYNISTPLLVHLMAYTNKIERMIFMLQKEVVDRICAKPNSKAYGRLTLMIQYFCDTERVITVPPEAFNPKPKVYSEVICLKPKATTLPLTDFELFGKITTAAFQQRRKTISNSLKSFLDQEDFQHIDLNPKLRAENISLESFVAISNYVANK